MHEGATLGRRFTALRVEPHDVPGVERWVAMDSRRSVEVSLDVLVGLAPGAVRQAAVRAAQVRDARFARVLASGRESVGSERVTYVVTERPHGVRVADLAGARVVPVPVASAIVGEAARALQVASTQGIHHGYVRSGVLTVSDAGRVVVAGLDADGELATQAGLGRGRTEKADAVALTQVFLALITGMDAAQVTVPDLPAELPLATANVARACVAGTGPDTLAQVTGAMGPADPQLLRDLRGAVATMQAVQHDEPAAPAAPGITVASATLHAAGEQAGLAVASDHASAAVAAEVATGHIDAPQLSAGAARDRSEYATVDEAAQFSKSTRRAVAHSKDEPLGLDTFDEINEEQSTRGERSIMQVVLEWGQRHLPQNAALDAATERARERARRSGPLNTGPLLVALFATGLLIVALVAYANLTAPIDPGGFVVPSPDYPDVTFSPDPLPSPSGGDVNEE